jgi:hypothetical protein
MANQDQETVTVADESAGPGGEGAPGRPVELPVVELLTGRGFITGKSGSGKSNTASVVVERLLDGGFPVLIVDSDGEYYGLKEEYEVLHAGADEECDITVSPEHAGKLADLALEGNVPIILDVSGYLDESVAKELILEVTRHLFAREKKLKKPFLMLVEECHEYIPEGAGMDETGKMLVKVGKRGRKHGLGVVGISQRPADVKKDFITQCDWLVWHRLTWRNDTKVVKRILGSEYADAIEDLDDGEAFLVTDWAESVRRVQFHRKRTFDAGATPGLDDVERPDLKSVNDDLVDELREISEERERRESELADLRQELERKEARIDELKRELEEAKDLKRMADRFSQALLRRADAPHREHVAATSPDERATLDEPPADGVADAEGEPTSGARSDGSGPDATAAGDATPGTESDGEVAAGPSPYPGYDGDEAGGEPGAERPPSSAEGADGRAPGRVDGDAAVARVAGTGSEHAGASNGHGGPERDGSEGDAGRSPADASPVDGPDGQDGQDEPDGPGPSSPSGGASGASSGGSGAAGSGSRSAEARSRSSRTAAADAGGGVGSTGASAWSRGLGVDASSTDAPGDRPTFEPDRRLGSRQAVVEAFHEQVASFDGVTRRMLATLRDEGPMDPVSAHVAAGGDGDRRRAYSRLRRLRRAEFVEHEGGGRYAYVLPELIREAYADRLSEAELRAAVASVEDAIPP